MRESRRICVVTGTRAEYGLLYQLMKAIRDTHGLELQTLVTGMHLSPEFGLTYRQIEEDGIPIDAKVEILLSSDSPVGTAKSMGLAMIGFADALARLQPDLLLVLGDRFEIFAAASAALVARLPIAHLHGGETTEGAFDEALRHSITKMSHLHFAATEAYRRRIIQLGEDPRRVFNTGAIGIETIRRLDLLERGALEVELGFKFGPRNLLITFHPSTLEQTDSEQQIAELLAAIDELTDTHSLFTLPNADAGGRAIRGMIEQYVAQHPGTSAAFTSLGQLRYLSAMRHVDTVVGNSSSGIIEAPSLGVGTVNIGGRQRGRAHADSVLHCAVERDAIARAIRETFSPQFKTALGNMANPYEQENTTDKILEVIRDHPLDDLIIKRFHDLPIE